MNNREIEISILLQIFLKKKIKTIFIVIIFFIVSFCYNYLKPPKFKISADFINKNFTLDYKKKKELNSIANSDYLNIFIHYKILDINTIITQKFLGNVNKIKPFKISILKQNSYVKKNINHLTIKKQKLMLNNLSSSIVYIPPKLSLIYHNEEEGKNILNDFIIITFEKVINSISVKILKDENEVNKIMLDIIKDTDIRKWFTYDQSKINAENISIDKNFNFLISTIIGLIFGLIYILYVFFLNEISLTKANLKE